MPSFSTGTAPPRPEAPRNPEPDVAIKHEEASYMLREHGRGRHAHSGGSSGSVSSTPTSVAASHFVLPMSDHHHGTHDPSLQASHSTYGELPAVPLQANNQGQNYHQYQSFSVARQTPAEAFTALFPPPPSVSLTTTQSTDISRTASSSRSSSSASYGFRPYSRASVSSTGDPNSSHSNSVGSPSSSTPQNVNSASTYLQDTPYPSRSYPLSSDFGHPYLTTSLASPSLDSRRYSEQSLGSPGSLAAHRFNPSLPAVPSQGLPLWPGTTTQHSRAKYKQPRHSRTLSADYLLDNSPSLSSHTSYAPPTATHSHLKTHGLHTPYTNAASHHQVPNSGNLTSEYLTPLSIPTVPRPGNESTFLATPVSGQFLTFSDMYHPEEDLDALEEYEDDDMLTGLPGGSPTSYLHSGDYAAGTPGSNESSSKKEEKQVRRRSSKACDQCRKSKCKCERTGDGEPCKSCILLGTMCTFLGPSRKRGPPKGYIDAIESRLHQTEALVGIMLALANPVRKLTDEENPKPDERARSLLEDLRNLDPLAREIIERVDRGAYGTQGRRSGSPFVSIKSTTRASSGSGDEKSPTSPVTAREDEKGKSGSTGPPASVHGRGRMVGLGQEIESGGLSSAHPSNEWQDTVTERLKAAQRARETGGPYVSNMTNGRTQYPSRERDRQRRRVDSVMGAAASQSGGPSRSPERPIQPRPASQTTVASASAVYGSLTALDIPTAHSPPSYLSPTAMRGSGSTSTEGEDVEDVEEGITDGVGQLSINEESQVRFHGKASGLHLLGSKIRMDGRNRGGVWHFPKARVWPPVARTSAADVARQEEIEALERAALARLPPRDVQEQLLNLYFAHVHIFLPIVHKESFMAAFRTMMDEQEKTKGSPEVRDRASVPRGRSASEHPGAAPLDRDTSKARSTTAETEGSERSVGLHPTRRVPTLLLCAMFAIAARFSPVAENKTLGSSPFHAAKEALFSSPGSASSTIQDLVTSVNGEQTAGASASNTSEKSAGNAGSTPSGDGEGTAPSGSDVDPDEALPMPQSGHMWAAGDGYLERAKELLDKSYATSRPSTCQALLLMGHREIGIGSMASSWLYIGMAVRMAQDLGMHRNSDSWSYGDEPLFTPVEQQVRKRIWYACVIMDKYVSTYIGRPLSIFEGDYDTPLPDVDASEETEFWNLDSSMPNSMLTDPIEIALAPNAPFKPVPSRVLSCFNESARLASIVASILHTLYGVKVVSGRHMEALQLERRLDKWFMDLPEPLRFDTGVKKGNIPSPNVLTLHMQYWCAVLLLHRPFIRHYVSLRRKRATNPECPVDHDVFAATQKNFDLCVAAANHITSLVSVYQDNFCLKRCSVFLSYYIFTAAIMHMTTLATNHNDPQASLGLSKCMDVLRRIEIVWPSAGRAWELLNGAKEDLPEHEVPFPSTDRVKKRSADDPLGLDDHTFLPLSRGHAAESPSHMYATADSMNGSSHRYDPGPLLGITPSGEASGEPTPLALFGAYDRWSPDSSLGFPASGLSTSVLPQQYSTGFIEDRHHHHQNAAVHRPGSASAGVAGGVGIGEAGAGSHARSPYEHDHDHGPSNGAHGRGSLQYWSDFSMGPPSSMLGSMYGMAVLSPHSNGGQGHEHGQPQQVGPGSAPGTAHQHVHQASPHSPHDYNAHPPFMGEHYNVFGH